jgi:hypothetical protein
MRKPQGGYPCAHEVTQQRNRHSVVVLGPVEEVPEVGHDPVLAAVADPVIESTTRGAASDVVLPAREGATMRKPSCSASVRRFQQSRGGS